MIFLKIKPVWQNDIPRLGVCVMSVSVVKKSGNLRVHYNDHEYAEYSKISKKWKTRQLTPLSKKQKKILVWSQQGLTNKEMAEKLFMPVKFL